MIIADNLKKLYKLGKENTVHALNDVSFKIKDNSAVAIIGPSGSGKSTLLNILGGLDRDYTGEILVDDKDIKKYNSNYYRRHVVGTIFQQFYLIPSLTVAENILLPITMGHQFDTQFSKKRLDNLLERLGLENRKNHKPNELSGGQAQRVAIARALIAQPKIVLADEPTGNLDSKTANDIVQLLYELNKEEGTTLIIVTHNPEMFSAVDQKIFLRDGKVVKN
ncbi:MAG TPA: ABC transporter ATP-binding protein [Candidatus Dojkabacteria bacterium]|nr:ABC transporter ATP-binding protein [Candidatus Dojkabacteria bacterium]